VLLAFDLDGVLVDTQIACLQSYRSAGVEPPDDHHTIGWETWCTKEQHDAKNEEMKHHLYLIKPLPLLRLALQRRAPVLSACSREALAACKIAIPELKQLQIVCELRTEARLNAIRALGEAGVYFDDSQKMCDIVKQETRWQVARVI